MHFNSCTNVLKLKYLIAWNAQLLCKNILNVISMAPSDEAVESGSRIISFAISIRWISGKISSHCRFIKCAKEWRSNMIIVSENEWTWQKWSNNSVIITRNPKHLLYNLEKVNNLFASNVGLKFLDFLSLVFGFSSAITKHG